jgi:hypothetical protein
MEDAWKTKTHARYWVQTLLKEDFFGRQIDGEGAQGESLS